MIRRIAAVAIILLSPLLLAAADPPGDTGPCSGHGTALGSPPDLVSAEGWIGEDGTSAEWRLRFAEPLVVPDPSMPAYRIDILVRDPTVPTVTFAYRGLRYRDLNRIIRFDATGPDQPLALIFIPEGGGAPFDTPVIDGDTMTILVPGRLLLGEIGDDLAKVDLTEMRWTVVVRDRDSCDFLDGDEGRPSRPLSETMPSDVGASPTANIEATATSKITATTWLVLGLVALMLVMLGVFFLVVRRRRTTTRAPG
ncbi:MAG TPA: hypothetical protein VK646_06060 [Actinomycetota bacterium]|nr:hypothetical protein [Actinomycetota bacterium]